jgi:pimeloyl-ACP methyl ester carboxylesterase
MRLTNEPFYQVGNGAGACLLIHGLGGGVYELQPLARVLHQQGWTVRGMNLPGHDQPAPWMPASTWPQWVDCVHTEYQRLRQDHEQVAVVGLSNGGLLALHLAAQVRVSRLVLLAPVLAYVCARYVQWGRTQGTLPAISRLYVQVRDELLQQGLVITPDMGPMAVLLALRRSDLPGRDVAVQVVETYMHVRFGGQSLSRTAWRDYQKQVRSLLRQWRRRQPQKISH